MKTTTLFTTVMLQPALYGRSRSRLSADDVGTCVVESILIRVRAVSLGGSPPGGQEA